MSAAQAWLSAVQQLKEQRKLPGKCRQHVTNLEDQAALAVLASIIELADQIDSNTARLATAPCASTAECEEIVSKVGHQGSCVVGRAFTLGLHRACVPTKTFVI